MAEINEEKAMEETTQAAENTAEELEETVENADTQSLRENSETPLNAEDAESSEEEVQDGEFVEVNEGSDQKKGFFGKKKDKKDKKDIQIEELTDQIRRQMAEFDNFRKRTEKEKSAMYEIGAKSVIEKILPVVDNFERGLAGVEENSEDPFTAGMQKIYKQLISTLEALGVKPIDAVGQEFDPDFHNAVMHVEDENLGENVVAEELQKGYLYRDSVVRHSMVKVAN